MMTLEHIRRRKMTLGYSNAKLSELSGIPLGTLNKILSGSTKKPHPEAMEALEKVLAPSGNKKPYYIAPSYPLMVAESVAAYGFKHPGNYTIDDYYALPDDQRVELIDGVFYDMAAPTVEHQMIMGSVYRQITSYILDRKGPCIPMMAPVDVKLDADNKTMVQPDVLVICDRSRVHQRIIEGGPDYVLEVVSPSSSRKDYVKKAAKYENAGVREYWIADPIRDRLTIFNFMEDGSPEIHPLSGKHPVAIYEGNLEIDLDEYKLLLP